MLVAGGAGASIRDCACIRKYTIYRKVLKELCTLDGLLVATLYRSTLPNVADNSLQLLL